MTESNTAPIRGRSLLGRFTLMIGGIALAGYGLIAFLEAWRAVITSVDRVNEAPGLAAMLGCSALFTSVVLVRESWRGSLGHERLARRAARAFGFGWIVGVALSVLAALSTIVLTRGAGKSVGVVDFLVELLAWMVVPLIFSIPGLAALAVSRRR